MVYICANRNCQKKVTQKALRQLPGIKCPHCGYRILYKKRPPVIKKIDAD